MMIITGVFCFSVSETHNSVIACQAQSPLFCHMLWAVWILSKYSAFPQSKDVSLG